VDNVPRKVYAVGGYGKTSTFVWNATRRPPPPAAAGGGAGPAWSAAEVPALPAGVTYAAAAWLRGRLYLTGGHGTEKQVLCWDPAAKPGAGWRRVAELLTGRFRHAAVVLGKALYVLGGYGRGVLASVERYDPDQDKWEAVAPMPTARYSFAAAILDGRIIAIGGYLRSCECFDPVTDKWEALPDMPTARSGPAATVLGGRLWVTGGNGGGTTVEVFDPATNAWDRSEAPMTTGRRYHALAVLFGELHAIGGLNETSVEKYDAQTDRWTAVPAMALPKMRNYTAWAVLTCPWRKRPKKALPHKKRRRPLPMVTAIAAAAAAAAAKEAGGGAKC
jgi:N-acetylneuraminic acid mutarotase